MRRKHKAKGLYLIITHIIKKPKHVLKEKNSCQDYEGVNKKPNFLHKNNTLALGMLITPS